jgi:hypothetical protein
MSARGFPASETHPQDPARVSGGHRCIDTDRRLFFGAPLRAGLVRRTPTSPIDARVAAGIDHETAQYTPYDRIPANLVQANGHTVFERYYRSTPSDSHNVASVTKPSCQPWSASPSVKADCASTSR